MPGPLSVYGFLNAKLKARISGILPPAKVEELVRARSLPEALVLLKGTAFEPLEASYARTGDLRDGEALLYSMEAELYSGLLRFSKEPVRSFLKALAGRYEVDTLKNALRLWFDGRVRGRSVEGESARLYRGVILHRLNLDAVLAAKDAAAAADALAGTPYEAAVREAGPRIAAEKTIFHLETALDRQYYDRLAESVEALSERDRTIARRMLGVEIDIHNLGWLVRAQSFHRLGLEEALASFVPRGTAIEPARLAAAYGSGSAQELLSALLGGRYARFLPLAAAGSGDTASKLASVERTLQQILRAETERLLGGHPFTIGTALAYFIRKRQEIRTVLAVLNAKYYSLPEERIRSAL